MAPAATTDRDDEKAMATTDVIAPADREEDDDEGQGGRSPQQQQPKAPADRKGRDGGGFFRIYKKGQGYWTRMGTAIGAGLLGTLIVWQIYRYIPAFMSTGDPARANRIALAAAGGFAVVYGLFVWRLMNKPANVDFLIATDSEMKKVNWTSKRELIGSTKVVILFMLGIALFLFVFDQVFNVLFYAVGVLKIAPPWWKHLFGG
jgi:preprotein translocase subunit SecE